MQQNSSTNSLEETLQYEINAISLKMAELAKEKLVLERLLTKAKINHVAQSEAVRRSSATRLIVERVIVNHIAAANGKAISSSDLFKQVKLTEYTMKASTFRSYLHRMKERQLIQNPKNRQGLWVLGQSAQT